MRVCVRTVLGETIKGNDADESITPEKFDEAIYYLAKDFKTLTHLVMQVGDRAIYFNPVNIVSIWGEK